MKTILAAALIVTTVCAANAGEFKLIDPHNPIVTTGVYNNLKGGQDAGGALEIASYGGFVGAVGGTIGQGLGGPSVALGVGVNLLPSVKSGSLLILTALYPNPDKFANLKAILAPPPAGTPDVVMAIGPAYSLVFYDGIKSKAMFTVFVGAEWSF